ncbi:hypothetical protein BDZ45DRAFT_755226 [Acephala macrosclerotiorum]|nr:hypothetical protein BDZ45DRAFT_755226 [Acephala macrosclerotiorum]
MAIDFGNLDQIILVELGQDMSAGLSHHDYLERSLEVAKVLDLFTIIHVVDRIYLLFVCKKSRQIALEKLRGVIPTSIHVDELHEQTSGEAAPTEVIQFDPSQDVVCFPDLERVNEIEFGTGGRSFTSFRKFEGLESAFGVMNHVRGKDLYETTQLTAGSDPFFPTSISFENCKARGIPTAAQDYMRVSHRVKGPTTDNGFINKMNVLTCEHCIKITEPNFYLFGELPIEIRSKI